MKKVTKFAIAIGTVLTLGLGAAAVSGQPYGNGPGWGGHMGGYGPGSGMGPAMMGGNGPGWGGHMGGYGPGAGMGLGMMAGYGLGHVDEGLAGLKVALRITAEQDTAWQAFAKHAKQQSENRQAWFAKMREARSAASAPELLAQQTEFMKQRQLEMAANAAALKDIYAALTPEQKTIADQRFSGFGPGWHRGGRSGPR